MKVRDFKGFMRNKAINEQENYDGIEAGMQYGANPEDEEMGEEGEGKDETEEEPLTIEDLKAMIDDLTARIEALESGEEDEEAEDEEAEGEEIEGEEDEDAEGEEA